MAFFKKKNRNWFILAEWHNWYIPFYIIIAFSLASHLFYRIHDEAIASGIAKVVLYSSFICKINRQTKKSDRLFTVFLLNSGIYYNSSFPHFTSSGNGVKNAASTIFGYCHTWA